MRSLLSIVALASLLGVPVEGVCPPGDLNGDCLVDAADLAVLAEQWLGPPGSEADFDGLNGVEARDFALLAGQWSNKGIPLVINEFMASNTSSKRDPQGEYEDWIEIHNAGSEAIDTAGMYLTDDLDDPTKWRIPAGMPGVTTLARGGHLLIWADNDVTDAGLHAAFELNSDGDEIGLFDRDGATLIDSIDFPDQTADMSYGRFPDANDDWRFFGFPTPGLGNIGAFHGQVADTKFSHNRGFYDAAFSVTIATETPGATIYYTIDGSAPFDTEHGVPAGLVYTGPVPITMTTCLRAMAFIPGRKPTNIDTHTYVFLSHNISQTQAQALSRGYPTSWSGYPADYEMDPEITNSAAYAGLMRDALLAIPTLSIATDRGNLFDSSTGIYANPTREGMAWERPASAELFNRKDGREFQVNCGLRIQGGASRQPYKCPKHSLSLRFRGRWGAAKLDFPLFEGSPAKTFESLQLRGMFNNSWTHWNGTQRSRGSMIRDQWTRDSLLEMGEISAGRGIYAHVYLNGMYWGVYNVHERQEGSNYAAYYCEDDDEEIDAFNGTSLIDGTTTAWNQMKSIVGSRDWLQILEVLDVNNYIDWSIIQRFGSNNDLKSSQNWRAAGGGPNRRPWRMYAWDSERILEGVTESGPTLDPPGLMASLDDIEDFRIRFADRLHKHLFNNGALTPGRTAARWMARADEIDLAIIGESARWGDYRRDVHQYSSGPYYLYTRNDFWLVEQNRLISSYFPSRTLNVLNQYKSLGFYPSVSAPVFYVNGAYKHGGHISKTDVFSMPAATGTYYTLDGSDPRLPTVSPGATTNLVPENAAKRVLVPTGPVDPIWQSDFTFDHSTWSLCTGAPGGIGFDTRPDYDSLISLDVEQQMYGKNASCYIRIPFQVYAPDLSEFDSLILKVRYDDGFVAYINGVKVMDANPPASIAWNSQASASHSDSLAIQLEPFDISNHLGSLHAGDNLLAIHGLNVTTGSSDFLISVELVAGKGGSTGPDVSPNAIQYAGPIALAGSARVKARVKSGGTWSALNEVVYSVGPVAESLRITEIMYHPYDAYDPNDPNEEYIELTNIGAETINLNLVRFTNGVDFVFPPVELGPGQYVLVVQ
ncbi:MAG: lamin tail domain-containing protein, partial [Phycisphaerales bacterium]